MNSKYILKNLYRILLGLLEFIIFVDFWVILAVSLWGGFSYKLVKIYGTYPEVHSLWRPILVLIIAIPMWNLLRRTSPGHCLASIFKNPWHYLISILVIYISFVTPVVLNKYYSFEMANAHDFAFQHHALYNTTNFEILRTHIFGRYKPFTDWNFLKDHYSLFILLLSPVYCFFKEGSFLLIAQTFVLSLTSIPIFLIAREKLQNRAISLLIAVLYLSYFIVIKLYFCESRLEYYSLPLLLFAIYAIDKGNIWISSLLLFLAVLCKEEVFLATAVIGVYIIITKRGSRAYRWFGLIVFGLSIIVFILLIKIIPKYFGFSHHSEKIIGDIIDRMELQPHFSQAKMGYFFDIFRNLGFVPLFTPAIILVFPFLVCNFLWDDFGVVYHVWHSTLIIPFLFISLIYAIKNLKSVKIPICIWIASFFLFYGSSEFINFIVKPFFENKLYFEIKPPIFYEYSKAVSNIPNDKSVFTNFSLLPNLSNRENIYWIDTLPSIREFNVDYPLV